MVKKTFKLTSDYRTVEFVISGSILRKEDFSITDWQKKRYESLLRSSGHEGAERFLRELGQSDFDGLFLLYVAAFLALAFLLTREGLWVHALGFVAGLVGFVIRIAVWLRPPRQANNDKDDVSADILN